ncbi:MAG: hypothetical protein AAF492_14420, partial [Verrucomicrobiota bacterium]
MMVAKWLTRAGVVGLVISVQSMPGKAEDPVEVLGEALVENRNSVFSDLDFFFDLGLDGASAKFGEGGRSEETVYSGTLGFSGAYRVEQPDTGFWLEGDIRFNFREEDGDGTNDFSDSNLLIDGPSRLGIHDFFDDDFARMGKKWYVSAGSPLFYFAEVQLRWNSDDGFPGTDDDPATRVGIGLGRGSIVDLGSYERVGIVENELRTDGLLLAPFTAAQNTTLLPLFQNS